MKDQVKWLFPADLRKQVMQQWERGDFLAAEPAGEPRFPLRLSIKPPPSGQIAGQFDAVRNWIAEWQREPHLRLEWKNVSPRLLGDNSIPSAVWLDTLEDAAAFIGKEAELEQFRAVLDTTCKRLPQLKIWVRRRPLQAIALANEWKRLLDVVTWLSTFPRPGIYIRQINVPGVHTKFVESHRQVLAEMLDLVLSPDSIDISAVGAIGFSRRYGLLDKPERIRFRFFNPVEGIETERLGLDLTIEAQYFASLDPKVSRVFITENEINFLAFPNIPNAMVIFGAGYGFDLFSKVAWLSHCRVQYWGDIDTHGFAILDQLRSYVPHVESLLMDHETLHAFRDFWGKEDVPVLRNLPRLNSSENLLYDDLRNNRFAHKLRLEQEHVAIDWLAQRLEVGPI